MAENQPNQNPAATPVQKLTFAILDTFKVAELAKYGKKIVLVAKAIEKAKDAFTGTLQFNSKIVAALKRRYVELLNAQSIPADTTFKKYFEQVCGGALPGRVESLASLFNTLVLTLDGNGKPMLAEDNFDAAAVDWLERANAIIGTAKKEKGDAWKTCDEVLDTINALSTPGDALKKLKEIRERQKPAKAKAEATTPELTVGRAVEFLKAAMKGAQDNDAGYALFCSVIDLGNAIAENEHTEKWTARFDAAVAKGVAPHILVGMPETPAEEVPAEMAA